VLGFSIIELDQFCMISCPNFWNPPVLISLLDPTDAWDLGASDTLAAADGGFASVLLLLWLGAIGGAAPPLLFWATDAGFWLLVLMTGCSERLDPGSDAFISFSYSACSRGTP
jgi:hypothetical protein